MLIANIARKKKEVFLKNLPTGLTVVPLLIYLVLNTLLPFLFPLDKYILIIFACIPIFLFTKTYSRKEPLLVLSLMIALTGILLSSFDKSENLTYLFDEEKLTIENPPLTIQADLQKMQPGLIAFSYPYALYFMDSIPLETTILHWNTGSRIVRPGEGFRTDTGVECVYVRNVNGNALFKWDGRNVIKKTGENLYKFTIGKSESINAGQFYYVKDTGFLLVIMGGLFFCLLILIKFFRSTK